jgi:hypothetical protein
MPGRHAAANADSIVARFFLTAELSLPSVAGGLSQPAVGLVEPSLQSAEFIRRGSPGAREWRNMHSRQKAGTGPILSRLATRIAIFDAGS